MSLSKESIAKSDSKESIPTKNWMVTLRDKQEGTVFSIGDVSEENTIIQVFIRNPEKESAIEEAISFSNAEIKIYENEVTRGDFIESKTGTYPEVQDWECLSIIECIIPPDTITPSLFYRRNLSENVY